MNVIDIFYKPNLVFEDIKKKASWVQSFIVISIISVVVAYFMQPFSQIAMHFALESKGLTVEQLEQAKSNAEKFKYFGLIAVPIGMIFLYFITSLFIYLGLIISKSKVHLVKLFSLIITASIFSVLGSVVNVIVLHIRGTEAIKGVSDLSVIGLNMLFKVEEIGRPMYQLLASFNIFELFYALTVIFGLSKIAEIKIGKSVVIFLYTWAIIALFGFGMAIMQGS